MSKQAFVFNGDYNDEEQVAGYLPAYMTVYNEITARGEYPYNDSFRGKITGLVADHKNEDTAIYLLQGLRHTREQQAKVEAMLAAGYNWIDRAPGEPVRYTAIALVPSGRMGGSFSVHNSARLVGKGGAPHAVIPKGKRTTGYFVSGRRVLARV